ncbi:Mitochondrial transcription termination factor family protein [Rhynchospora pubera]|uniref:Mitochondrial transcription termination factor family protein n=1 Tax=Rhynchospora pubera TaxID=906938 RepID=A0AAV8BPH9_9POAL|nr:Mitochondrial transcription termination factor family protein [Rhynchospora pubera]KAJ4744874.1 Mitochondrial transcription termination factor family protein [Rhynchospora pubera]
MSSFLAKRILLFSSSSSPLHHHHFHHLVLLTRHSLSTQSQQSKELPFIAQYLISSFAFSFDRALKCSADSHLRAIKSSERPESVVAFLKATGLSHDQIKAVVSFHPLILAYNVEKTLKPKVRELMDAGFSRELLVQLIRYNPTSLLSKDTLSRLLFWRDFVGGNEVILLNIVRKNGLLVVYDIDNHVVPRINLLKEYGLSNQDIARVLANGYSCCMSRRLETYKHILDFIEGAGIPRDSGMFLVCFKAIGAFSKDTIEQKMEFFKMTYGWSQDDVYSAFKKFPYILSMSMDKVKSNMNFLTREAKLEPRSIVSWPHLLGYSLQKRLVPRHHVLNILCSNGFKKNVNLWSACILTEKRFIEKYIEPYKEDVPGLAEAYFATCGSNTPV